MNSPRPATVNTPDREATLTAVEAARKRIPAGRQWFSLEVAALLPGSNLTVPISRQPPACYYSKAAAKRHPTQTHTPTPASC